MRLILMILAVTHVTSGFAQGNDTVYNDRFRNFLFATDRLIDASHRFVDTLNGRITGIHNSDSMWFYANTVLATLKSVDSVERSFLQMPEYFAGGKMARSQDQTSKVAQQQCSYDYYIKTIRKAGTDIEMIGNAALELDRHLKDGFPPNRYCPYYYAPVTISSMKPVKRDYFLPDSIRIDTSKLF